MGIGAIAGGRDNVASGDYANVSGGRGNDAQGYALFAAGSGAHAAHAGSFVWADSADIMTSTADNQFLIRASGGVGIGTDSPSEQLEVVGVVHSSVGGFRFPDNTVQTTAATPADLTVGTGDAVLAIGAHTATGGGEVTTGFLRVVAMAMD